MLKFTILSDTSIILWLQTVQNSLFTLNMAWYLYGLLSSAYKEPCFVYSRVGGNRTPLKQPVDNYDDTLMFEARFESGNLQKVVKV